MSKNKLSAEVEHRILMGLTRVQQVGDYINRQVTIDSLFAERLRTNFASEYLRLRNDEKLEGDELFDALLDYASGGTVDFKNRAAGLTVLVYLFEKCEVFEK